MSISTDDRIAGGTALAEVVATVGLLVGIFGTVRSGRVSLVPFAVAAYITGAYWFTASTSFANPAVTIGRTVSETFAGVAPSSVPGSLLAQLVETVIAIALVAYLYPNAAEVAADVTQPHDEVGG